MQIAECRMAGSGSARPVKGRGSAFFCIPAPPLWTNRRYELTLTFRCVPGSQACSGRAGGAGCQSKARSTIWCIWWNHQREVKGEGGRLVRNG